MSTGKRPGGSKVCAMMGWPGCPKAAERDKESITATQLHDLHTSFIAVTARAADAVPWPQQRAPVHWTPDSRRQGAPAAFSAPRALCLRKELSCLSRLTPLSHSRSSHSSSGASRARQVTVAAYSVLTAGRVLWQLSLSDNQRASPRSECWGKGRLVLTASSTARSAAASSCRGCS